MITVRQALEIHHWAIERWAGSNGVRDPEVLESALARPFAAFGGEEFYPAPMQKAAALLESIVINHPFIDGNKRTGFLLAASLLDDFYLEIEATEDELYAAVIRAASGEWKYEQIAEWLAGKVFERRA